jgi:hypothetical protein
MVRSVRYLRAVALILLGLFWYQASALQYSDAGNLITIDAARYKVSFRKSNGSIESIIDKTTGSPVCYGNNGENLWATWSPAAQQWIGSSSCSVTYSWDGAASKLSLRFTGTMTADVTVAFSDESWMELRLRAQNTSGARIEYYSFPCELRLKIGEIQDAFYPRLPGVVLSKNFFTDHKTYDHGYPGFAFADFLAARTSNGVMALYTTEKNTNRECSKPGYHHGDDTYSYMFHEFRCELNAGATREFPPVRIRIGDDYIKAMTCYREENGIDQFPSLADKLGSKKKEFLASPLYKWNIPAVNMSFQAAKAGLIDKLAVPGILQPVAFQPEGHDQHYPDFLPPDPKWGSTDDMKDMVSYAHQKGCFVVPYVNFSWWNTTAPTVQNLPAGVTIKDISLYAESYGTGKDGYVVNPNNAFVQQRIGQERDKLCNYVGLDGLLEDQWGIRVMPSTSYFNGVQKVLENQKEMGLTTECGADMQAQYLNAFIGSMYDFDVHWPETVTPYEFYFPMAGIILRDKSLLFQHGLSQAGWTHSKYMLKWNLAYGYQLSSSFYLYNQSATDPLPEGFAYPGLHIADNPWIKLVGVFQRHVLGRYADELVQNFEALGDSVYKTTFKTFKSYTIWKDQAYTIDGYTIAANGGATFADDGSAIAGVFTRFNDRDLSAGDHYLAMVRDSSIIKVFQPKGAATDITLTPPGGWSEFSLKAYTFAGTELGSVQFQEQSGSITFNYQGNVNNSSVGYYRLQAGKVDETATIPDAFIPSQRVQGRVSIKVTVYNGQGKVMLSDRMGSAANLPAALTHLLGRRHICLPQGMYLMALESPAGTSVCKVLAGMGGRIQSTIYLKMTDR